MISVTLREADENVLDNRVREYLRQYPKKFFGTEVASRFFKADENLYVAKIKRMADSE